MTVTIQGTDYTDEQAQAWYQSLGGDPMAAAESAAGVGATAEEIASALNVGSGADTFTSSGVEEWVGGQDVYGWGDTGGLTYAPETEETPTYTAPTYVSPTQTEYVAPTYVAPEVPAAVEPREVQPEELVEDRLLSLLTTDNPFKEAVLTGAAETSASRGLVNTSMGTEAGMSALIEQGVNVVAPDAATYATAALSAQQATELAGTESYRGQIAAALSAQDAESAYNIQVLQNDLSYQQFSEQLVADAEKTAMTLAQADQASFGETTGEIMQQYQSEYASIITQPDSVMDAAAKTAAIDALGAATQADIDWLASVYSAGSVSWGTEVETIEVAPTTETTATGADAVVADAVVADLPQNYIDYLSSASTTELTEQLDLIGSYTWQETEVTEDEWKAGLEAELATR